MNIRHIIAVLLLFVSTVSFAQNNGNGIDRPAAGTPGVDAPVEVVTVNNVSGQTPFTNPTTTPNSGDTWFNSVDKLQWTYNGTTWVPYENETVEYNLSSYDYIVSDSTCHITVYDSVGVEIFRDTTCIKAPYEYLHYVDNNTGEKGDYITFEKIAGGEILTRVTEDYTPTDLLSDLQSGKLEIINETCQAPTDFDYPPSWDVDSIYVEFDGEKYRTNYDDLKDFRDSFMIQEVAGQTYWVSNNGNNTNDGLSEATAFKTIRHAKDQTDAVTVMVKAGYYDRTEGIVTRLEKDMNFICYGGDCITGSLRSDAITQNATYANVWEMNVAGLTGVLDARSKDQNGIPISFKLVNSIQEVSENTKSYFLTGTTAYINHESQPVPGEDVYVLWNIFQAIPIDFSSPPVKLYMEGFTYLSGIFLRANEAGSEFYAYDCKFAHNYNSSVDGPFMAQSIERIFLNKCISSYSVTDGFNYHDIPVFVTNPQVVELNCKSFNNGIDQTGTDQGSSCHEDYNIIRVNGEYEGYYQIIADVNDTKSINLGIKIFGYSDPSQYAIGNNGTSEMWIINPRLGASLDVSAVNASSRIWISCMDYPDLNLLGAGDIRIYGWD